MESGHSRCFKIYIYIYINRASVRSWNVKKDNRFEGGAYEVWGWGRCKAGKCFTHSLCSGQPLWGPHIWTHFFTVTLRNRYTQGHGGTEGLANWKSQSWGWSLGNSPRALLLTGRNFLLPIGKHQIAAISSSLVQVSWLSPTGCENRTLERMYREATKSPCLVAEGTLSVSNHLWRLWGGIQQLTPGLGTGHSEKQKQNPKQLLQ